MPQGLFVSAIRLQHHRGGLDQDHRTRARGLLPINPARCGGLHGHRLVSGRSHQTGLFGYLYRPHTQIERLHRRDRGGQPRENGKQGEQLAKHHGPR